MKKRGKNKKAEGFMGMGFGMIFSIFLIIFFFIVAFIAIGKFLEMRDCSQVGIFYKDFQYEVDRVWSSQTSHKDFSGILPPKVKYVCFADFSKPIKGPNVEIGDDLSIFEGTQKNLFLYPREAGCEMETYELAHIDLETMTKTENPYCIDVDRGSIIINLGKESGQGIVRLSRK